MGTTSGPAQALSQHFSAQGKVAEPEPSRRCSARAPVRQLRGQIQPWCWEEPQPFLCLRLAPAAHKAISRAEPFQLSFSSICKALLITRGTCFSDLLIFVLSWQLSAENTLLAVLSPLCPLLRVLWLLRPPRRGGHVAHGHSWAAAEHWEKQL